MRTILLVEDEENDIFFVKRAMEKAGIDWPLQVARDGQEAIDYLQGSGQFADREKFPTPSIVLLDLKLPHVTGLEVLRWMRQQHELQTVIVIALTSSKLPSDIEAAYRLRANAYLVKPATPDKMVEMIQSLKQFWIEFNLLPSVRAKPAATAAV